MRKHLLLLLLILLAGCAAKPKDLIVGKWEYLGDEHQGKTVEFQADGALVISMAQGKVKATGKYRFVQSDAMEVEVENLLAGLVPNSPSVLTKRLQVQVTADELATRDDQGRVVKARRIK